MHATYAVRSARDADYPSRVSGSVGTLQTVPCLINFHQLKFEVRSQDIIGICEYYVKDEDKTNRRAYDLSMVDNLMAVIVLPSTTTSSSTSRFLIPP